MFGMAFYESPCCAVISTPQRKPPKFTPRISSTPSHQLHPSPGHVVTKKGKVAKKDECLPSSPPPSPGPAPLWNEENGVDDGEIVDDSSHGNQEEEVTDLEKPDVYVEYYYSISHGPTVNMLSRPEAAVSVSGWETVRDDLPSTEEVKHSADIT